MNKFIIRKIKGLGLACSMGFLFLFSQACEKTKEPDLRPRLDAPKELPARKAPDIKLQGIFVDAASKAVKPDGKSWEKAFPTIAEGIDASLGEQVIIAAGTYKSPKIKIINKKDLKLVGGYRSGDKWEKPLTNLVPADLVVLDGEGKAEPLLDISGASRRITFLGGMVFKNVVGGPAVLISGTAAKLIKDINIFNCVFENNQFLGGTGGALKIDFAELIHLTNSIARKNQAQTGGFISVTNSSKININGGEWLENKALGGIVPKGGAFYGENIKSLRVKAVVVKKGQADLGGGIYLKQIFQSVLADALFENNTTSNGAGAEGGAGLHISDSENIEINKVSLINNKTKMLLGSFGGGMRLTAINNLVVDFLEAKISANKANAGGALSIERSEKITVKNGHFLDNEADSGGGALFIDNSSDVIVEKSNFEKNKTKSFGGSLHIAHGSKSLVLRKLIFVENEATVSHGGALAILDQLDNQSISLSDSHFDSNISIGNGGAALFRGLQGKVHFLRTTFENNRAQNFGGALALDARSFRTNQYIIEADSKFIKNISAQNAGGGAVFISLSTIAPPAVQLEIKNTLADYSQNRAGNGSLGNFLRATNHLVDDMNPATAPPERGGNPPFYGAPPLLDIKDFISDSTGHDFSESQNIFLW